MKTYIYCDRIEKLHSQLLILPIYQNERPLLSLSSKIDWRLCGKLSSLLKKEIISGKNDEKVIFAPQGKLFFNKIFLWGMGTKKELAINEIDTIFKNMFSAIKSLAIKDYSIAISQFVIGKTPYEEIAYKMIENIAKIKKKNKEFPEVQFLIVNGREELLKLANCLKRLDRNIPIDMSIEVVSP